MTRDSELSTCLKRWASELADSSDSARLDAEILFRYVSDWSATQLVLRDQESLDTTLIARVDALVRQRAQGQPIAYLVGEREFYSLSLKISPEVLIPRPETELLVDRALAFIHEKPDAQVLDLGTGSGAIALAIASHAPQCRVLATDISPTGLDLARENAARLDLGNVSFLLSNWYEQLDNQRFDLILSNPPYIDPDDPHLESGDVRFEPRRALAAAERGLADIKRIVSGAPEHLCPGGLLALEHGYDQGEATRNLMTKTGLGQANTERDLNRHERISSACLC